MSLLKTSYRTFSKISFGINSTDWSMISTLPKYVLSTWQYNHYIIYLATSSVVTIVITKADVFNNFLFSFATSKIFLN